MRKILLMLAVYVLILFLIPILFTSRIKAEEVGNVPEEEKKNQGQEVQHEYGEFTTIRLLRHATGEIEELPLDEYLVRCSCK